MIRTSRHHIQQIVSRSNSSAVWYKVKYHCSAVCLRTVGTRDFATDMSDECITAVRTEVTPTLPPLRQSLQHVRINWWCHGDDGRIIPGLFTAAATVGYSSVQLYRVLGARSRTEGIRSIARGDLGLTRSLCSQCRLFLSLLESPNLADSPTKYLRLFRTETPLCFFS